MTIVGLGGLGVVGWPTLGAAWAGGVRVSADDDGTLEDRPGALPESDGGRAEAASQQPDGLASGDERLGSEAGLIDAASLIPLGPGLGAQDGDDDSTSLGASESTWGDGDGHRAAGKPRRREPKAVGEAVAEGGFVARGGAGPACAAGLTPVAWVRPDGLGGHALGDVAPRSAWERLLPRMSFLLTVDTMSDRRRLAGYVLASVPFDANGLLLGQPEGQRQGGPSDEPGQPSSIERARAIPGGGDVETACLAAEERRALARIWGAEP